MSAGLRGDPFHVNARRKTSVLAHAAGDLHKRAVNAELALKLHRGRASVAMTAAQKAEARLAAAAPDMLVALQMVMGTAGCSTANALAAVEAAIRKATEVSA